MADTVFDADRTGLILIDTVNDFLSRGGKAYDMVDEVLEERDVLVNLQRLLGGAREREIPIFFAPVAYTADDYRAWTYGTGFQRLIADRRMFEEGSWGAEFHAELWPREDDVVLGPHKNLDVFATTDLDTQLRRKRVEYAVFAGVAANLSVEATLRSAVERGFHVTAVRDAAAAAGGLEAHDMAFKYAFPLISHTVMTVKGFLRTFDRSAPGRAAPPPRPEDLPVARE